MMILKTRESTHQVFYLLWNSAFGVFQGILPNLWDGGKLQRNLLFFSQHLTYTIKKEAGPLPGVFFYEGKQLAHSAEQIRLFPRNLYRNCTYFLLTTIHFRNFSKSTVLLLEDSENPIYSKLTCLYFGKMLLCYMVFYGRLSRVD